MRVQQLFHGRFYQHSRRLPQRLLPPHWAHLPFTAVRAGAICAAGRSRWAVAVLALLATAILPPPTTKAQTKPTVSLNANTLPSTAVAGTPSSVTVTITDPETVADPRGVTLSTTALSVPEGGTLSYTVKLATQPTGIVYVVAVMESGDGDLTVSSETDTAPNSALVVLEFTTLNWSTAQTVTVTVAQDEDKTNGTATILHLALSGGYDRVRATITASEVDDDELPPLPADYINYLRNQGISENQLQQDLDPDHDGSPNVFEYYFGSDASDTSSFSHPVPIIVTIDSNRYHALRFIRSPSAVGVEISVQFSDSPSFESLNGDVPVSDQLLDNGLEQVVVRSGSPLRGKEFSRLIYRSEDG